VQLLAPLKAKYKSKEGGEWPQANEVRAVTWTKVGSVVAGGTAKDRQPGGHLGFIWVFKVMRANTSK
jgi:hypothetical protein